MLTLNVRALPRLSVCNMIAVDQSPLFRKCRKHQWEDFVALGEIQKKRDPGIREGMVGVYTEPQAGGSCRKLLK